MKAYQVAKKERTEDRGKHGDSQPSLLTFHTLSDSDHVTCKNYTLTPEFLE